MDIIAPGVKLPSAADAAQRQAVRDRLGWDADTIGCLLVARNPLRKGLPALLDALAQLPAHYRLLVVGADEATRERVRGAGAIAHRVALIEPTEVAQYFSAADIYAHPLNDSYGMAPLEAMSHGLPVVVSSPATAASRSICRQAGRVDPAGSAQRRAAGAGAGTACSEPELRASLAERGLAIAREQSWEAVAARYEASTRRCCANGSRRRPEPYAKQGSGSPFSLSPSVATGPNTGSGRHGSSRSSQPSQCIACSRLPRTSRPTAAARCRRPAARAARKSRSVHPAATARSERRPACHPACQESDWKSTARYNRPHNQAGSPAPANAHS